MAMILSGVPNYMVMLIGRLKSNVFLTYIHKQVAKFTKSVSQDHTTWHGTHPTRKLAINRKWPAKVQFLLQLRGPGVRNHLSYIEPKSKTQL